MKLKLCPWCGSSAIFKQEPLWQELPYGTIGYIGNYGYYVQCSNTKCGAIAPFGKMIDINISPEQAKEKAINKWNDRKSDIDEDDFDLISDWR